MHAHINGWTGLTNLAAGVTGVRDMGNENKTLQMLMRRFDTGEMAGPEVVPSGLVEATGEFALKLGINVDGLDEGLAAVQWYAEHGYHQIKIYNSVRPEWVAPLARAAHDRGLRVAGHVPVFMDADRAIADGYDEITHTNRLML